MSARDAFVSTNQSFGIFCGIPFQRDQLLLNLLSSYCNKIGIVLLHNNLSFENQLGKIYTLNPSLGNTNFKMILANQTMALQSITSYYDPLYGLNDNEILNVIVPSTNYGIDSSIQQLRSILSDYLSIIKYQFSKRNDIWGNYPYSLDLLLELTSMPFDVLRNEVLTYLPSSSSTEGGYFAQFNSNSNSFVHEVELSSTPPIISPPSSDSASAYYDEEYEHEMQRLKKQQRSIQRDYNRLAISNFFRNIQWRNVFRILFILGIIILAIVIWNMRYVIIESITNFLISLIPIIIIIAILWYLIKNLFKY